MGFNSAFSDAFQVDEVRLVTVDPGILFDLAPRPSHPPYSPLWGRFQYPVTPAGLLLFRDGRVKVVDSFYDSEYIAADDRILGGYGWYTRDDSWQAQVLADAGYTLIDYTGVFPPEVPEEEWIAQ